MALTEKDATIAYDVGRHAGHQAMEVIARAVGTVPAKLSSATTVTAHAFILAKIKLVGEQMDRISPGYTKAVEEGAVIMEHDMRAGFERAAEAERKRLGLKTAAERS